MAGKTTSAGYRLPVSSEYHHKCIAEPAKKIREAAERAGKDKTFTMGEYRNCNKVAQENIWKEHVHNEMQSTRDWGKNWGFLLEYDFEGKPQQKKQLSENQSFFTSDFPTTTSSQVGGWGRSPESREMQRLERMMRHNKMKTDLKDYDTN